jgi:lysophospholipase L1-like esterase
MEFTIKGPKIDIPEQISIKKPLLVIGSCFAENIGAILKNHMFDIAINPFGIVYNPLSIIQHLKYIIQNKQFTKHDLFEYKGLWKSWHHHGSFAAAHDHEVLNLINLNIEKAHQQLLKADWLIITLGSAYYYTLKNGQIVSNCHKVPASNFEKKLATRPKILDGFQEICSQLQEINPTLKVLFNVSPVRYIRDGLTENTISKSMLHLSINELVSQNKHCFYFPSYEIMIDELRDYRFYKEDMVHPNETAIAYIYEKFAGALFDDETKMITKEVQQFNAFSNHKVLNHSKDAQHQHQLKIEQMQHQLLQKYSFLAKR